MRNIIISTGMKRINLLLICCAFSAETASVEKLLVQARKKSPEKTQVLFCINPNDCINCLYNFHVQLKKLQHSPKADVTLIFKNRRSVERSRILKTDFADVDTTCTTVIWSDVLYNDALKQSTITTPGSVILIYDKTGKPVLRKLVKEINGTEKEINALMK